jgi:CBS domain containing-hemolysin-like protein
MNDDRSRSERPVRSYTETESVRDHWYDRFLIRLGLKPRDSIRHDLEDVLSEVTEDADFSPQERAMLKNVLGFHRLRVEDVMVPRADIIAVESDIRLGDLLNMFRTAGHSRLPVYGDTLDDPKGMVHIRDFLDFIAMRADDRTARRRRDSDPPPVAPSLIRIDLAMSLNEAQILRPVLFVPRSMPALDLLVRMQATRTHMALVIDEYGGTDGLVSIEDLVEMVVGDIEDEHDDATTLAVTEGPDGTYIADARASLEEINEILGIDLSGEEDAEDIDTIGGLIVTIAGRVPARGEIVGGPANLEFEVLDADPRRIKRLRILRRQEGEPAPEAVPGAGRSPPESAAAE